MKYFRLETSIIDIFNEERKSFMSLRESGGGDHAIEKLNSTDRTKRSRLFWLIILERC
mgnify:CR=1 FL=1